MTFDPTVPASTDSPAIFPSQNQANMAVLQANIARDHQFNNTPNSFPPTDNTGYHNLIHMTQQAPSGILAATGRLYVKSAASIIQLFYMDDTGNEYQLTPFSNGPVAITGNVVLAPNAISSSIFLVPSFSQGTIFAKVRNQNLLYTYDLFYTAGTSVLDQPIFSPPSIAIPTIFLDGSRNLYIQNNYTPPSGPSNSTIDWFINMVTAP